MAAWWLVCRPDRDTHHARILGPFETLAAAHANRQPSAGCARTPQSTFIMTDEELNQLIGFFEARRAELRARA